MSSSPPKKVIVTGGAGYIGSHVVVSLLLTRQYQVIVLDNYHNSYPSSLERCEEIALSELGPNPSESAKQLCKPILIKCDLNDERAIRDVFERFSGKEGEGEGEGIWGVVHIAALKAVGESGELPLKYYRTNVSATIALIDIMLEFKCNNFVYSSSATVYGIPPKTPIPETSPVQPESCYGRTKAMIEQVTADVCRADKSDKGLKAISLRYFNPAGAHPSGRMGEEPRGRPGNLLPLLAQMAVGRLEPKLKVFGNDYPTVDGTCVRDYLHVMDLAHGHILALQALQGQAKTDVFAGNSKDDGAFRAFNLGSGGGQSVLQIADAMTKATGVEFEREIVGRRLGDVPILTADPTLAERELGFQASHTLDQMCADLWRWQSMNPNGYE